MWTSDFPLQIQCTLQTKRPHLQTTINTEQLQMNLVPLDTRKRGWWWNYIQSSSQSLHLLSVPMFSPSKYWDFKMDMFSNSRKVLEFVLWRVTCSLLKEEKPLQTQGQPWTVTSWFGQISWSLKTIKKLQSCSLFLDCGCGVASSLKSLLSWHPTMMNYALETK